MYFTLNPKYGAISEIAKLYPDGIRLDLGCGYYKPHGYVGIDDMRGEFSQICNADNMPDIFMDLNVDTIPFVDNSCIEVRSSHFFEHSDISHVVRESYRVLIPGGDLTIIIPYANSAEGLYPGHTLFLTEKWFFENIDFQNKFRIIDIQYFPSDYWKKTIARFFIPFSFARTFFFNACWQIMIKAKKK